MDLLIRYRREYSAKLASGGEDTLKSHDLFVSSKMAEILYLLELGNDQKAKRICRTFATTLDVQLQANVPETPETSAPVLGSKRAKKTAKRRIPYPENITEGQPLSPKVLFPFDDVSD